MRTTVNIEARLLRRLKREAESTGRSLTEVVNRTLELGIEQLHPEPHQGEYRCPTFAMGEPAGVNLDKALGLAAALEDEEVVRKLQLRK